MYERGPAVGQFELSTVQRRKVRSSLGDGDLASFILGCD
jgi:hypothetical protein